MKAQLVIKVKSLKLQNENFESYRSHITNKQRGMLQFFKVSIFANIFHSLIVVVDDQGITC